MQVKPVIPPELTPEIVYLRGEYSLSKYIIPYFSAVVPFSFAIDKFSLIEDIPDAARMDWSLSELFQRDIAWDRIHDGLVKYLRNENLPQFFNALTIALLPRSGHGFGGEYESAHLYPPIADPALVDPPLQIGGIQIQAYKDSGDLAGKLRWDPKQIIAVAVDGQHRLAAVKALKGIELPAKLDESSVPIIFLVPDKRVGFVEPPLPAGAAKPINTLRQVFIDLNKNAREVSRARTILLDDQDIPSVCVRLLMGERLSSEPEPDRIPLAMIDWMSERKNKIDEGPFVSTVLLLRDIVDEVIKQPDMEEFDEEDKRIKRWLQDRFEPSGDQLVDLMSQVQRCFHREVPVTFTREQIGILRERFASLWRPYLYRIFSELTPYHRLWKYGKDHGFHAPPIVNLYAAKFIFEGEEAEKRAERIVNEIKRENPPWSLEKDFEVPLNYIDSQIKDGAWAFTVVFQKALFGSFVQLLRQGQLFTVEQTEPGLRAEFTTKWIEAINRLFELPVAAVQASGPSSKDRFWAGIGLKADYTIDFTQAGAKRIAQWLNAWVCLYWLRPDMPTFSELEKDSRPLAEVAHNALSMKGTKEGMIRLARTPATSASDEESDAQKLMKERYQYLRKQLQQ